MSYATLIVDDEPNARAYLEDLVSENNALQLCGTCVSGNEALRFCETLAPEIIFLDIQMPGINGIETARALLRKKATTPIIIFTTAYDQYAIQAFEVEAIGYLLKPFSKEQFSEIVKRAVALQETVIRARFDERMQHLFDSYERKETSTITAFNIIEKGLEISLQAEAIEYLIADSEYVAIHSRSRKYLKRLTLELLAKQLPQSFIRIHRSIIINRNLLQSWKYLNNGTYSFHFSNGVTLKSSRSYQQAVQAMLSPNDI